MNIDLNIPPQSPARRRTPTLPLILAAVLALLGIWQMSLDRSAPPQPVNTQPVMQAAPDPRNRVQGEVEPGSSFSTIISPYLSSSEIHQVATQSKPLFPLTRIVAGHRYSIETLHDRFDRFTYDIDSEEQLVITRTEDGFAISTEAIPYQVVTEKISGIVTSSLFAAVDAIGEGTDLAIAIADIFAWDIDFILDIRTGDSFTAIVEKRFRDGEPAGYGPVQAALFRNQEHDYFAFRHSDASGRVSYYDETGESLRKAFLKAPLSFTRISSGFSLKRLHPITKTWKSHPAIDYAASVGTPIKAVGDGTITRIGYTNGNGNFIELRHSGSYRTMYLHMNAFARGMKKGKKVTQGDVIGYVGQTGLATGPHLCFRMFRNDTPVNPASVRSKGSAPVPATELAAYRQKIEPFLVELTPPDETFIAAHPAPEEQQAL